MDKSRLLKSDCVRLGVLAALCLALGTYLIVTTVLISKDGVFYIGQARGFAHDPLDLAQRHQPGYPFLVWVAHEAAVTFLGRDSVSLWIHASQVMTLLCHVVALVPLYFLGKSLVGGARAFWAVLILIILPYPAHLGSDVLRDWPYVMFLSLGFWLLYQGLQWRAWWMFALVGLDAVAAYLTQPASVQLIAYGLLGIAVALRGDARYCVSTAEGAGPVPRAGPLMAAVLLLVGFAGPVLAYVYATDTLVPPQFRRPPFNLPPVITSVGGKGASRGALEFRVQEGQWLEIDIEVSDPQDSELTFSPAAIPVGSRPVYQFRLTAGGACFTTISDDERDTLLEAFSPAVRTYERIAYYAYAQADARPGLEPVHRFWSSAMQRHFYTISPSEKDTLAAKSPPDLWSYEGIAFYAFAPGRQPLDVVPVRRFRSERTGHSWAIAHNSGTLSVVDGNAVDDGIAWYVHAAGEAPAGMLITGRTLRWRPGPAQRGEHGVNLVVSDGELESCQLLKIDVTGPDVASSSPITPALPPAHPYSALRSLQSGRGDLSRLPAALNRLFAAFAESLMVFFLAPWVVGLHYRMRHEAGRLERVLIPAVVVVNAGLIVGRYVWVSPGVERRYCLACVALTIFYVPVGLERIAHWLSHRTASGDGPDERSDRRRVIWFHILAIIGLAICLPKLLTPPSADKNSYMKAIEWLRDNTRAQDVIAVPDSRLTFYAQRPGLVYHGAVDPRRADYIVRIAGQDAGASPPSDWSQEYSVPVNDRRGRILTIYKTHRRRG